MVSLGSLVQAVTPANANEAPISFRKLRRVAGSSQFGVRSANSSSTKAWNSLVSASSSRLFQYCGPWADSSRARILSRSRAGLSVIGADHQSLTKSSSVASVAVRQTLYVVFLN